MEEILQNIGLTQGESRVYLALLKRGTSSVGNITHDAEVSRSKIYDILERLKDKGLVSEFTTKKIKKFQAAKPEKVLEYLKAKEQLIKNQEKQVKQILPKLQQMSHSEIHQEVRLYSGFEGVKTFYEELINQVKKGDEYLVITMENEWWEEQGFRAFFKNIHAKRLAKKIKTKVLFSDKLYEFKEKESFPNGTYFQLRKTKIQLPQGLVITKNNVSMTTWGKKPSVFVIESEDVANKYKEFFYDMWKQANKD